MKTSGLKYTDVMKPEDISIAKLWLVFAGAVLPANASELQRVEMRKAFYAGFVECFKIVTDLSDVLPEDQAVQVLDRLHKESAAFFEEMVKHLPASHPRRRP